ncbi:Integral membrane protein [Streptomyces globisporus]|uniref:Integral membrane protein n=1 Tax=Streptomyces globisporus TaxID=1908 RepID=A0ABM9H050_STRGL|nr:MULTISPECIES: glycosyltransferase family 39 protein [Streptomyces]RDL09954.1 4-amino-4-deoxy-L-arabinose transferase-like glycosyltransferase [Streptomyces sp. HB202]CAH9416984.1 Integral membrane protein [Streptomyces globisporus]
MTTATTTITTTAPPPEPDRGSGPSPRWARPALYGLLLAVGLAYVYNLSASGYANSFYSAAVQAGSQSWKALFFGSLDSANAITVDKPPAALWPMALSVRLFGLNSWAILAPQVLMALATAAVLNSAVRRRFGPAAGLIAVAVFALTPVAALMFRFNNPDALLALLMTVTVWCVLRALEQGRTRWLLWAGAAVGFAFLTKTLQAFLILPPLAVLYAVCAPVPVRKRIGQLGLSALTMVVAGGWWVAIVELMPESSRPYVGGSQNNSFLELTFGYNGLGRINGEETGSVGGGGGGRGGGGGWGETGIGRMFNTEVGGQIAWLLPAALILLVAGLWLTRKAARTDSARAAFIAWGGALVMTAAVFSFMAGIFHQYYTVALAPYIAALVAMGVTVLWEERGAWWPRAVLAGTVLATVLWAYVLLGRTPDYLPWLRWAVLAGGIAGALGLLVVGRIAGRGLAVAVVGLSCAASLAGPTAYTVSTLNSGHQGSIVTAGPSAGGFGMGGGPGGGGGRPGGPGGGDGGQRGGMQQPPGQAQGQAQGQGQGNQQGNAPGGMPTLPGAGTAPGGTGTAFGEGMRGGGGGGGGGMGGLLNGATVDAEAKALLTKDADDYTWVAAAVGAQNAASYQLATGEPVMAIGGFNGSDPSPTLAQFKKYVAEGKIHYFVSGGGMGGGMRGGTAGEGGGGMGGGPGGMGSSGTSSQISSWVTENFTEVTVGSATFYDLTQPVS